MGSQEIGVVCTKQLYPRLQIKKNVIRRKKKMKYVVGGLDDFM